MTSSFQAEPTRITGADFLRFLLTPSCVNPEALPLDEEWMRLDFSQFGKTETEIKQFLERKAKQKSSTAVLSLTGYFYADLLNQAMSKGLIYRLNNPNEDGKAYYGVPQNVRTALELNLITDEDTKLWIEDMMDNQGGRLVFLNGLKQFLCDVNKTEYAEVREYSAQLALNAVSQQDLQLQDIPPALLNLATQMGLIAAPHYADLTVLLEACQDTTLFKSARLLCYQAIDANLLPASDVDDVLQSLNAESAALPVNPFMVLN